jgi:hypothetical protein
LITVCVMSKKVLNNTHFDTAANVWLIPFSFELTFRRIFEHVASFRFLIVADFMH